MGRTLPSTSRRDPVENDSLRQLDPSRDPGRVGEGPGGGIRGMMAFLY